MSKKQTSNDNSTLVKGGRKAPDFTLQHIAEDVSKYFKEFPKLKDYEKEIEKKYEITKQHDDCWPANDIKKVWGKTQRLAKTSERRKCLSLAIMLQLIKRSLGYDEGLNAETESQLSTSSKEDEQKEEEKNTSVQKDEWNKSKKSNKPNFKPQYIQIPLSVMYDRISESKPAEVQNVGLTHKLIDRVPNFTEIKVKKSYVMLYDNRTKNAAWVYEILNKETVKNKKRKKRNYVEKNDQVDESINELSDNPYRRPYNHGHLAAAANHRWCQEAYDDTFLLSNISPQHKDLNKDIWEELERLCRKMACNIYNIHVYTGPLYLETCNNSGVVDYKMMGGKAVPTHFFKVIIKEYKNGKVELVCYKIPNKKPEKKLDDYKVKITEIEQDSGLIFTEEINNNEKGIDSLRIVTWKEKREKGKEKKEKIASTEVRITTLLTDYEDCAHSTQPI